MREMKKIILDLEDIQPNFYLVQPNSASFFICFKEISNLDQL